MPVKSNDDADQLSTFPLDDINSLPDCSTSGNDIINDNNLLSLQTCTDNVSAFTVVLCFFTVEAVALLSILGEIKVCKLVD